MKGHYQSKPHKLQVKLYGEKMHETSLKNIKRKPEYMAR